MLKTLILAAAIALPIAAPAAATDRADTDTVEVSFDDLDLADPAGQRRLDRRIDAAARRLCGSGVRGFAALRAQRECIALALDSASPQAERAIALARGGQRLAGIEVRISG